MLARAKACFGEETLSCAEARPKWLKVRKPTVRFTVRNLKCPRRRVLILAGADRAGRMGLARLLALSYKRNTIDEFMALGC